MTDEKTDIVRLAAEISRYVDDHPDAADQLDGIARWWLTRQRYASARSDVREALEYLVESGVMHATTAKDGKTVYKRAKR